MFFTFTQTRSESDTDLALFSYKIVKNPASVYSKTIGAKTVLGKYTHENEYSVAVINNPVDFIKTAKDLNMSNYVHVQLAAVCPYNLGMIADVFRSALLGKHSEEMTEASFFAPGHFEANFGPFAATMENIEKVYSAVGFEVEDVTSFYGDVESVFVVRLKNVEPVSLTEFLQKTYIGAMAITSKQTIAFVNPEQVLKLARISSSWLNKIENRNLVVQRLFAYNKKNIALYDKTISDLMVKTEKEIMEAKPADIESLKSPGLHRLRHETIIGLIDAPSFDKNTRVVELGCGGGQFAKAIKAVSPNVNYIGMDYEIKNWKEKDLFISGDISCPRDFEKLVAPDVLICTEVLEHNTAKKRQKIVEMISGFYVPRQVVITVPNIEYNSIYGLAAGELRHRDHKTEYTREQFDAEVVSVLNKNYNIEFKTILGYEGFDQPSWVIVGTWKHDEKSRVPSQRMKDEILSFYWNIYLPNSGYDIRSKEILSGAMETSVRENGDNVFYLAPTIPPCDYIPGMELPYLEHPSYAFEYYRSRGIKTLYEELKHMGSNVSILLCGSQSVASYFGVENLVTINTRNGHRAFKDRPDIVQALTDIALSRLDDDEAIAISAEAMPWNLFGAGLISREFRMPGEAALVSRTFIAGFSEQFENCGAENAREFLVSLDNYDNPDMAPCFEALNLVFHAKLKARNNSSRIDVKAEYGAFMKRNKTYEIMDRVCTPGSVLRRRESEVVDLDDQGSKDRAIERWEKYCKTCEGVVYKIDVATKQASNGYYFQPMMKVRGRNYLRLIYGIDYLDKDCFDIVKRRGITNKRKLAIQQHELSISLVSAFVNRNQHKKFVAAFMGMETVAKTKIDATL